MKSVKRIVTVIVSLVLINAGILAWFIHHENGKQEADNTALAREISQIVENLPDQGEQPISGKEVAAAEGASASGSSVQEPADHIYAHRGCAGEQLEHSFTSYDKAISEGARYIEQDVVISADGTLYLSHDETAARLTGDGRSFAGMSDGEIDALRTGAGEPVLRLGDVFQRYGDRIEYVVELKSSDQGTVDAFTKLVRESGLEGHIIVQCFQIDVLEKLEEVFPDMPKLYLIETQSALQTGLDSSFVDIISVKDSLMNEGNRDAVRRAEKQFSVWTLNSEEWLRRAIEMGVDSYFTDEVARAVRLEKEYRNENTQ